MFKIGLFWHLMVCKQKQYFYLTELFEILFSVKWPDKGWYAVKQNKKNNQSFIFTFDLIGWLVGFDGISMTNPVCTYILNIYDFQTNSLWVII